MKFKLQPFILLTIIFMSPIYALSQTETVTVPKAGMHDTLVERLVRENVTDFHGTCQEVVIEDKTWTHTTDDNGTKYKYIPAFARYVDAEGKCWLIEYRVEAQFNPETHKFDSPYCRGNGYGQGVEMKCE